MHNMRNAFARRAGGTPERSCTDPLLRQAATQRDGHRVALRSIIVVVMMMVVMVAVVETAVAIVARVAITIAVVETPVTIASVKTPVTPIYKGTSSYLLLLQER